MLDNSGNVHEAVDFNGTKFEDSLLESLVILTKLEHNPHSASSLVSGLPLVDNKLTPDLFHRAANRAGFNSKIKKRDITDIPDMVLPVILLLKDNKACVLESFNENKDSATLIFPSEAKSLQRTISIDKLNEIYLGYCIFVSREFVFDNRTPDNIFKHNKHWLWGTIWQSKGIYRDVLIASFFINVFVIATPLYMRTVMDRVLPNNAVETLWMLSLGVLLIFIFDFILKTLRGHFIDVAGKKADIILSSLIFEKIMSLRMEVRPESVGAFSDNVRSYESIRNFLTSATIAVFIDVPFFFLFILVIYLFAGSMAMIPLIAVFIIIAYSFVIKGAVKKLIEKNFKSSLHKNATLIESMTAVETIKTMGAEGNLQKKWEESVGFMANQSLKIRVLTQSINNFSAFIRQTSIIAVIIYGIHLVSINEMSSGTIILCFLLSARAIAPMAKVAGLISTFENTKTSFKSLNKIMELPVEREQQDKFIHRPVFQGQIDFRNVSFHYPNQKNKALDSINISIKPGEKVAFIGRIGSGKTTMEKLMLSLYKPTDGQIRIDNIDINQIDPADLRRNIGYISQDITLFHGTVRDNISMRAPYVSDAEILRVADIAGVTNFTNNHPSGFDMPILERGEGLSGGQRQSIAVARSLLLDPPILLMDEPSNAMDNNTEAELKEKLINVIANKTLILVTHKASLLALVDRIILLDNGKVVADGPKETVLEALKQGKLKVGKG
ncbi:MAG: type I secretion system permease/ATPase [Gammaproteobacteria bacterium]|nr:type I secretion system permease/ATPase [Gammaproteobacteria bacterium]